VRSILLGVVPLACALAAPAAAAQDAPDPEASCATRVNADVRDSIVVVEVGVLGSIGTGFVFHSTRHVATALHVPEAGFGVSVRTAAGEVIDAEVVAVDEDHDLAILELERPIPGAEPLELFGGELPVGLPVVAIGHPFGTDHVRADAWTSDVLRWTVTTGIVSAVGEIAVQTDAAVHPGNSGGPLLSCDGRVVGVVSRGISNSVSFATRVSHLAALVERIGEDRGLYGWFSFELALGGAITFDPVGGGFYFGLGVLLFERVSVWGSVAFTWGGQDADDLLEDDTARTSFGAWAGWRLTFRLGAIPLAAQLGVGILRVGTTREQTAVLLRAADPTCMPAPDVDCRARIVRSVEKTEQLLPSASLRLRLAVLEVGYELGLDFGEPKESRHLIRIGFWL
jgi:hypothetical protein